MGSIADEVNGANTVLVERVLEEYGDPARPADESEAVADEAGAADDGAKAVADEAGAADDGSITSDDDRPTPEAGTATADDSAPASPVDRSDADGAVLTVDADRSESDSAADAETAPEGDDRSGETGGRSGTETTQEDRSTGESQATDDATSDPQTAPSVPDPGTLTETQLETLRVVHERPAATQAELADTFGITPASISQRVNSIDGFAWTDRQAFTEALFGAREQGGEMAGETPAPDGGTTVSADSGEPSTTSQHGTDSADPGSEATPEREAATAPVERETIDALDDRLTSLATQVDRLEDRLADRDRSPTAALNPDLTRKVIHACFDAEDISADEEREIVSLLMTPDRN